MIIQHNARMHYLFIGMIHSRFSVSHIHFLIEHVFDVSLSNKLENARRIHFLNITQIYAEERVIHTQLYRKPQQLHPNEPKSQLINITVNI